MYHIRQHRTDDPGDVILKELTPNEMGYGLEEEGVGNVCVYIEDWSIAYMYTCVNA